MNKKFVSGVGSATYLTYTHTHTYTVIVIKKRTSTGISIFRPYPGAFSHFYVDEVGGRENEIRKKLKKDTRLSL